jgi:hypothetical protein
MTKLNLIIRFCGIITIIKLLCSCSALDYHPYDGLQFCLYGHNHVVAVDDVFSDGLLYYGCASINKRSYLLFTIKEEGYDYEVVEF